MNSKRAFSLTSTILVVFLPAMSALAADLPVKAPPIMAAGYDWSGVYAGVHAGYGGGMKDWELGTGDFVARGALVGGQVGINKQLASFVFGLELDGSWADMKGSQAVSLGGVALNTLITQTSNSKIDGLLTFAGRAGLAADRWFVFAKAGVTMAHETHSFGGTQTINLAPLVTVTFAASGDDIRYAPMLGFGTEYALGGNWSVKGEYDYIHFGAKTSSLRGTFTSAGVSTPVVADIPISEAIHVAKLGINYRFGGIAKDPSYTPVPPAPGTNWSGGYVGLQAGYGWGRKQWPAATGVFFPYDPQQYDMKGWLGGGTIGANAQAGVFVFGVEGEILGTGVKGGQSLVALIPPPPLVTQTTNYESKIDWLALATARAGFVVGDRLMLYGKGGIAIAEENHTNNVAQVFGAASVASNLAAKAVHTGAVVGAGGEYALGNNWSVKLEYDYIKMFPQQITTTGTTAFNVPPTVGPVDMVQRFAKLEQDLHLVKIGVNYHFNPMPVVVAKY